MWSGTRVDKLPCFLIAFLNSTFKNKSHSDNSLVRISLSINWFANFEWNWMYNEKLTKGLLVQYMVAH